LGPSPLLNSIAPFDGIKILHIPVGFSSFIFLQKILGEDVQYAKLFPSLGDVQVAFGIFF
jgi:hypothetical protein